MKCVVSRRLASKSSRQFVRCGSASKLAAGVAFGVAIAAGGYSANAADQTWKNTATNFNDGGSWVGGAVPGSTNVATFDGTKVTDPQLTAPFTLKTLAFSTTGTGYDLTASDPTNALTLTGVVSNNAINALNTTGTNTVNASLILSPSSGSGQAISQAAGGTLVINGALGSAVALTTLSLAGGGTITLAGSNTFSAGVTISGATTVANLNNANALGSANGTLTIGTNGATIDNTSGAALTLVTNNPVSIANSMSFSTAAGTTANSLTFGSGTVSYSGPRTITLNGAGSLTFGGALAQTNTTSQTLTVNNGAGTASTTAISFGGFSLSNTNAITSSISGSAKVNIAGTITDNGTNSGFTYGGTGQLTMSGANAYNGLTTVNGAGALIAAGSNSGTGGTTVSGASSVLQLNSASNGGLASGVVTLAAGTLQALSPATLTNNISISMNTVPVISGSQSITTTGSLQNTGAANRTVTNNMTGTGVLTVGGVFLSDSTTGRTFTINGSGKTVVTGAVADSSAGSLSSGVGSLTYGGTGSLILQGNSTYSGATTVNGGGTLYVNGAPTSGAYTVSNASTLAGNGSVATASNASVTLAATARLSPGSDASPVGTLTMNLGTGVLNMSGAANTTGSSSLLFDLADPSASDKVLLSGTTGLNVGTNLEFDDFVFAYGPTLGPGTYTLFDSNVSITGTLGANVTGTLNGLSSEIQFANNKQDVVLVVVPEPASLGLIALGGLGLMLRTRRANR